MNKIIISIVLYQCLILYEYKLFIQQNFYNEGLETYLQSLYDESEKIAYNYGCWILNIDPTIMPYNLSDDIYNNLMLFVENYSGVNYNLYQSTYIELFIKL